MKAVKSIVAILLLVSMVLMFAACTAKPSGTYEALGQKLKFKGNKVTLEINAFVATTTIEGKFEMDGENIVIVWEGENAEKAEFKAAVYDKENDTVKAGILTFKKAD